MIYYLENNKKLYQLMCFLKTCLNGNQNVCFMWNKTYGWLMMQNIEYLNNLDSNHLVLMSYFKMDYFSSFMKSPELNLDTATFEIDITNIYKGLRSTI